MGTLEVPSPSPLGYGELVYSNNLLHGVSIQEMSIAEYIYPVRTRFTSPVAALYQRLTNSKAFVSFNDSSSKFYVLKLSGTAVDIFPTNTGDLIEYGLNTLNDVVWTWANVARQLYLNVFAPNNALYSILLPSLFASNLSRLIIEYHGFHPSLPPITFL